ncbi:MAG: c-type cytochrome [Gemmatimonadota bacterium]
MILRLALVAAVLAAGAPLQAQTAPTTVTIPLWAFPTTSEPFAETKAPFDTVTPLHVPGSARSFTMAQVKDRYAPPDWFPSAHRPMPAIVAAGRKPAVWACGYCHLPDGQGRAENATLAGLPAAYMMQQVADFRTRSRRGLVDSYAPTANMLRAADSVTDAEVAEAAKYFSRIRMKPRFTVVERAEVPRTMQIGGLYAAHPAGGTEPIGQRIVELTESAERHELRDPNTKFTAYVPPGSIARGKVLATKKTTPATACSTCHGPDLRGAGIVPPIAGRSASYLFRQLLAFKTGARATPASAPMQHVVSSLSVEDMIAVAAYAASRRP